jgi:hypothetical protein
VLAGLADLERFGQLWLSRVFISFPPSPGYIKSPQGKKGKKKKKKEFLLANNKHKVARKKVSSSAFALKKMWVIISPVA